ncbi:MAG: FxsA family protein [Acidobacteria bacterium]|nr:FxsA family protein [Acidobacteriota bacterium]
MWYLIAVFLLISLAEAGVTISLYRNTGLYPSFGIILTSLVAGCFIEVLYNQKHKNPFFEKLPRKIDSYEYFFIVARQKVYLLSIGLLFFPGILTDILGMALLLKSVQTRVVKHIAEGNWEEFQQLPQSTKLKFFRKSKRR